VDRSRGGVAWLMRPRLLELYVTWLWCPVFDGFSSRGTVAAWGSNLGNPRPAAFNGKGRAMMARLSWAVVGADSTDRTAQATDKTGAVTLVEGRWGVGSARAAP
jgi:hypothetical protein